MYSTIVSPLEAGVGEFTPATDSTKNAMAVHILQTHDTVPRKYISYLSQSVSLSVTLQVALDRNFPCNAAPYVAPFLIVQFGIIHFSSPATPMPRNTDVVIRIATPIAWEPSAAVVAQATCSTMLASRD